MQVGEFTYGVNNIDQQFPESGLQIKIGKYCSIAKNVKIFLGGEHQWRWATTWPFGLEINDLLYNPYVGNKPDGISVDKGDVVIGNDVWIAHGVTIMSGIKISDGAVLAANSHIIKDVGPYEIWGGNPAKFIKKRFSDDIINKMMLLKWWDYSSEKIKRIVPLLQSEPTVEKIDLIKEMLDE